MTTWLIMQRDFQKLYLRNYAPSIFWILGKLGTLELIVGLYGIDKYTLPYQQPISVWRGWLDTD